jgi:hypothetical protein
MRQSQVRRHFVHWQGLKRINIAHFHGAALRDIEGRAVSAAALTLSFFNQHPRGFASSTALLSAKGVAHRSGQRASEPFVTFHRWRRAIPISKAHSLPSQQIERVAIFIDGANLYAASRTLGFEVDYKNLLAHFRQPVFVKGVVRCLLGSVSDFVVAGVALGIEADVADGRPVSDLT